MSGSLAHSLSFTLSLLFLCLRISTLFIISIYLHTIQSLLLHNNFIYIKSQILVHTRDNYCTYMYSIYYCCCFALTGRNTLILAHSVHNHCSTEALRRKVYNNNMMVASREI